MNCPKPFEECTILTTPESHLKIKSFLIEFIRIDKQFCKFRKMNFFCFCCFCFSQKLLCLGKALKQNQQNDVNVETTFLTINYVIQLVPLNVITDIVISWLSQRS
jgi:hypothetical protein